MNDQENAVLEFTERICPKRPWVLATLTDDEALGPNGQLPTGLAFHLRQCDSCRATADSLQRVTSKLERLAAWPSSDTLCQKGNARVEQALREGAPLTGRFETLDVEEIAPADGHYRFDAFRWPLSAAAILLIAVGVASWFNASRDLATPTTIAADEPVWPFDDDVFGDVSRSQSDDGLRKGAAASITPDAEHADDNSMDASTVADASTAGKHRRNRPSVVMYHSHISAAMNDSPGAVQAAVVIPRRRVRGEGASWRDLFDRSGAFLFTTSPRETE